MLTFHKHSPSLLLSSSVSQPHQLHVVLHHTVGHIVYSTQSAILSTSYSWPYSLHHTVGHIVYIIQSAILSTSHSQPNCLHHTVSHVVYITQSTILSTSHSQPYCLHHTVSHIVYIIQSAILSSFAVLVHISNVPGISCRFIATLPPSFTSPPNPLHSVTPCSEGRCCVIHSNSSTSSLLPVPPDPSPPVHSPSNGECATRSS